MGYIGRPKGDGLFRAEGSYGFSAALKDIVDRTPWKAGRESAIGRVLLERAPIHILDAQTDPEYRMVEMQSVGKYHSILFVPLMREGVLIGALLLSRRSVRPFTDRQIDLVKTFADQAVIAIENVRLFEAEQQRTRELTESLEQQTATSEVLKVISGSPGDLQPVFQTMLENATRICEANFGTLQLRESDNTFRVAAMHNPPPVYAEARRRNPLIYPSTHSALGRVIATKQLVHIADYTQDLAYKERDPLAVGFVELAGARTLIIIPMLKEGELIGNLLLYRQEVRPFTEKQIALLTSFAAQAVIAIENTRLLNELRESLEQQTATSEVLKVISSSPGELQPVFQAMLENAVRICEAKFGALYRIDGEKFHFAAEVGTPLEFVEHQRRRGPFQPLPGSQLERVLRTKQVSHTDDATVEFASRPAATLAGARSTVAVPMLKDDVLIGAIFIYRTEVRPFTEKQIEVVKNFAAQAVIAIENTRLLNELRQRTDDLTESLEQQTATSEVLTVISSSSGKLEPVFDAMLKNATRICQARFGALALFDGQDLRHVASYNLPRSFVEAMRPQALVPRNAMIWRVVETKQVVHFPDVTAVEAHARAPLVQHGGVRSAIAVPMLKEDVLIGVFAIYRQEVRPFTDKQIELVQNFAAQAVIAIENARLLNELRESLQQQTATADVLKVISR